MFKDKILFLFKRCDYNNNKISTSKDLLFLPNASFIIIIRSFKLIIKNDSNENNFDINHFKDVFNKKRLTSTLKTFKEMKIQKSDLIDIAEINASTYYHFVKNRYHWIIKLIKRIFGNIALHARYILFDFIIIRFYGAFTIS